MNAHVRFDALYREDMLTKLKALQGHIRSVEVAMTKRHPDQSGGVFGTLIPETFGHRAPSIRFTLGMGRYGPRDRYLDGETEEQIFCSSRASRRFRKQHGNSRAKQCDRKGRDRKPIAGATADRD